MNSSKKIFSLLFGAILIFVVIYLGYKNYASPEPGYIFLFGLACALAAPIGISALGYAIKREDTTLKKLSKIPQIDDLIKRAETQEEKIKRLETERKELMKYIQFESQKYAAKVKKESLEEDAKRILYELKTVDSQIASLEGTASSKIANKAVTELAERLKEQEPSLVYFSISAGGILSLPYEFLYKYLQYIFEKLFCKLT